VEIHPAGIDVGHVALIGAIDVIMCAFA